MNLEYAADHMKYESPIENIILTKSVLIYQSW